MEISVVIATYKREKDLQDALLSLLRQSEAPHEVVVIDDSSENETEELVRSYQDEFKKQGTTFIYFRNTRARSLTVARNIGSSKTSGDIILFIDDDVELAPNYLSEIRSFYESHPKAVGAQGTTINDLPITGRNNAFRAFFALTHYRYDRRVRVLSSTEEVLPYNQDHPFVCERLAGSNQSYRRMVFNYFHFDEALLRWACKEDLDFSYRVHKRFTDRLFCVPTARLVHKTSMEARMTNYARIKMCNVYSFYLFFKNMPHDFGSFTVLLRSQLGKFLFCLGKSFSSRDARATTYFLKSIGIVLRHLRDLEELKMDEVNRELGLQEGQ
ncbi:MAG: glycosyltransferase family 2 protein [Candidatus Verstraetearchaeota archaeon]|nr:glycosyltransferase family 2 protein [Candidatus Verstraetearchaeota archaeon]